MSRFVGAKSGYEAGKQFLKKVFGKKSKVSPDITSVKPNLKKTVRETKSEAEFKNFEKVEKFRKQKEEGIKSARKAQKELQRAAETKRATKIGRQYFARSIPPRASDLNNPTVAKTKKFKTGKQIEAEKRNKSSKDFFETQVEKRNKAKKGFMGGGMAGRRMGYSQGSKGKIPTTPKEKSLAKLAPPRDRITFGDVVTGRTKGKRMQASVGGGADTGRKPKKRGNPAVIKEEPMRDRMKQPLKRKKP